LGIFARDAGCASVRKGRGIGAAGAAGEICRFATGTRESCQTCPRPLNGGARSGGGVGGALKKLVPRWAGH
jgi:hypothetical protein